MNETIQGLFWDWNQRKFFLHDLDPTYHQNVTFFSSKILWIINENILTRTLYWLCKVQSCDANHKSYSLFWCYFKLKAEVGSAACFSGPQYTIPQLCYRSAQSAITQCFQICQCAMRNAAIADISAMHNHSKKKIKFQNNSKLSALGDDPPPYMY